VTACCFTQNLPEKPLSPPFSLNGFTYSPLKNTCISETKKATILGKNHQPWDKK